VEGMAPGESRQTAAALDAQVPGFNARARLGTSQEHARKATQHNSSVYLKAKTQNNAKRLWDL